MLIFDGIRNVKSNSLKTDISNQALQIKDSVPRYYDKDLKLADGCKIKSDSIHNNNRDADMVMVQSGSPGRGDQGGRGRGRGRGGKYG